MLEPLGLLFHLDYRDRPIAHVLGQARSLRWDGALPRLGLWPCYNAAAAAAGKSDDDLREQAAGVATK